MTEQRAFFTLIEKGEVYTPARAGVQSILLGGGKLLRLGHVDADALRALGVDFTIVDASDCFVLPGLIDPHEHLLGAGGEQGVASRLAEVPLADIVLSGITTVVGCLGTDVVTRQLPALLGRVRQLEAAGITAWMYTGGFPVPTPTITGSVASDMVLIDRVIGVGEVAIADARSSKPSLDQLATLVADAFVGGTLSDKAGITHFHVGPGRERLRLLHALLDQHEIQPEQLYATHINRGEPLMDEAIALAARGAYVDIDTVEGDVGRWLHYYRANGGELARLTLSSDAHTPEGSPAKLFGNLVASVSNHGWSLAEALPLFTTNPARALKLRHKGALCPGMDGDVIIADRDTLAVVHVFARGRHLVQYGQFVANDDCQD